MGFKRILLKWHRAHRNLIHARLIVTIAFFSNVMCKITWLGGLSQTAHYKHVDIQSWRDKAFEELSHEPFNPRPLKSSFSYLISAVEVMMALLFPYPKKLSNL